MFFVKKNEIKKTEIIEIKTKFVISSKFSKKMP